MKGGLVISLDFELMWGVFDVHTIKSYGENVLGGRTVIPKILDLFKKYKIHATWAIVGMLYCKDENELLESLPDKLPDFSNRKYSAYEHISIANLEDHKQYYFSPELIKLISNTSYQEIGTHTFSHFYCLEIQNRPGAFEEDVKKAINIAQQKHNSSIRSIVFPRNQYNSSSLDDCIRQGIYAFRGVPDSFVYSTRKREKETLLIKLLRFIDSYINFSGFNTYKEPQLSNGIINIKASAFLRPYNKKLAWIEALKIKRIKRSMTYAAKNNLIYHLWWHPHNFGKDSNNNLENLEKILEHYRYLNLKYGFNSLTMQECAQTYKV